MKACAKINLFLDITGLDGNGYHLIDSVMQSVTLCDEIEISEIDGKNIIIECDKEGIPCDERNITHKAAKAFFERTGFSKGIKIIINKKIPHEAGLGGGSADAAAVLVELNDIFNTSFNTDELCEIGKTVGADVPFCIVGGTMRAGGIGEKLAVLPSMPNCHIVIAKPPFGVSTKRAYSDYDRLENPEKLDVKAVLTALENADINTLGNSLSNAFEQVVPFEKFRDIKEIMLQSGALGCLMSGSGSAVFALFSEVQNAQRCAEKLDDICSRVHICEPCEKGVF